MALKEETIILALINLGQTPPENVQDAGNYKNLSLLYDSIKEELLVRYMWKFAAVETVLDKPKKDKEDFLHDLPKDFLVMQAISPLTEYSVTKEVLRSSYNHLTIRYTRIVDDKDYPPFFKPLLVSYLTSAAAVLVTQSEFIARKWETEASERLAVAISIDSAQQPSKVIFINPIYRAHFV